VIYLQCTKSVQRKRGIAGPAEAPVAESVLGNWTVNHVPVGERRAFLFMSDRSLLSFPLLEGQRAVETHHMLDFLAHRITQLLESLNAPKRAMARLLRDTDEVVLTKAPNRLLLAIHSAIATDYFHRVNRAGGVDRCNLGEIIAAVNETPRSKLNWSTSFEVTLALLQEAAA
jgi:hypothetical protein